MIEANVIFLNDVDHDFVNTIVFGSANERSYGIALGDLDGGGDLDIVIANSGSMSRVYLNTSREKAASMLAR